MNFFAQHPHQHLVLSGFSLFLILGILMNVYCYLLVVFICIYLMIHDVDCLFKWLLDICISSLMKHLLESFAHIFIVLYLFLLLSFKSLSCILNISVSLGMCFTTIFFPIVGFSFFLKVSFAEKKSLILIKSNNNFCFYGYPLCCILKLFLKPKVTYIDSSVIF